MTKTEQALEAQIGLWLRRKGLKLTMAESCTGGLIGHRVTNIAGSSDYYLGSVTAYAYEAKEKVLGVSHETLAVHGAVSRETVLEMAQGARRSIGASFPYEETIGLSVSGIAGPGGGLPGKPVGLVWTGLSTPDGDWAWQHIWPGDRLAVKAAAAEKALQLLMDYLQGHVPPEN